jgi:hypothetical protein
LAIQPSPQPAPPNFRSAVAVPDISATRKGVLRIFVQIPIAVIIFPSRLSENHHRNHH